MREFMTSVSDYFNERRNDPEKQENRLALVVTGIVAVVIIVLLIVLLWGYAGKGDGDKVPGIPGQTGQEVQREDTDRSKELSRNVHEEEAVKYMSEDSGEQLRQEYLTSTAYLREKVEELLSTMTQVQDGLAEVNQAYKEGDSAAQAQIVTLCKEVDTIVQSLKETQIKLNDLTDIIQAVDQEKIPMIQQQIQEIRGDMEQVQTDISGLHAKMAALEKEDEKLWASISSLEKSVKKALNQNVAEVNNRLDQLQAGFDHLSRELEKIVRENVKDVNERIDGSIGQMEERIRTLTDNTLSYRYDAESNTLYLTPMKEQGEGQ